MLKLTAAKLGPFDRAEPEDSKPREDEPQANDNPKRGQIRGLSGHSAHRLMQVLACNDYRGNWWHVCLTYGKEYPETKTVLDRHRRNLTNQLTRLGLVAVWRLEFQERGAPHWHLLIHNSDPEADYCEKGEKIAVDHFREWWAKTYNPSKFGSFSGVRDMGKAGFYLAAHHAKKDQGTWPDWYRGRAWGFVQKELFMENVHAEEIQLAEDQTTGHREIIWLHRFRRRFLRAKIREDRRKALERGLTPPKWRKGRLARNMGFTWYLKEQHHAAVLSLADELASRPVGGLGVSVEDAPALRGLSPTLPRSPEVRIPGRVAAEPA